MLFETQRRCLSAVLPSFACHTPQVVYAISSSLLFPLLLLLLLSFCFVLRKCRPPSLFLAFVNLETRTQCVLEAKPRLPSFLPSPAWHRLSPTPASPSSIWGGGTNISDRALKTRNKPFAHETFLLGRIRTNNVKELDVLFADLITDFLIFASRWV